jgi:aminopeptidase YwaD
LIARRASPPLPPPLRGGGVRGGLAALLVAALLAGCAVPTPTPIAVTPRPPAPSPAATAPATATLQPPAETPTPTVTAGPLATDTPQPTATPVAPSDPLELVRTFQVEPALAAIRELAGAPYAGRRAGTPGADLAAQYLAAEFARLGLQPAAAGGAYTQTFPLTFLDLAGTPELSIVAGANTPATTYTYLQDFRETVVGRFGGGSAEARVTYVAGGYPDDFAAVNIENRIVLVDSTQRPGSTTPVIETALDAGASAVLVVIDNAEHIKARPSYIPPIDPQARPVLFVAPQVAAGIAASAGVTLGAEPAELDVRVRLSVPLQPAHRVTAANVLAFWPGSDPQLRDRVLIIGAHYDHLGQLPSGEYFPGAGDNASGPALLIALAESWRTTGFQPRLTVLFAAWSAEEAGLAGSTAYLEHPARPLTTTLAVLNLDQLGQGDGEGLTALYIRDLGLATQLAGAAHALGHEMPVERGRTGDDQPFSDVGVPTAVLSAAGPARYSHRLDDTPQTIEAANLSQAGQIIWLTVMLLQNTWTP